jgi:hypothetical protein
MGILRVLEITSLLTTILGLYLLGEKNAFGFLIFTVSLLCQALIFYKNKNWFLIFQMFILVIFNIFNYFKWMGI